MTIGKLWYNILVKICNQREGGIRMFRAGDFIMYASEGVCRIEDIRTMAFESAKYTSEEKTYYVLMPQNKNSALIYVPTDSAVLTARMREITPKQKIEEIIDSVKGKIYPWINDRKRRGILYRQITAEMRIDQLLLLICSLYNQRHKLEKENKKMAFSDNEMLSKCEALVRSEFAFSLGIDPCEVGSYIKTRLDINV